MRRAIRRLLLCLPLVGASFWASAQVPPGKQIRIIVPFAAGGTSDILGRRLAQRLGERLGRPVIVENRVGAGGSLGIEATVRAEADGSTILLHSGAIATEPSLKKQLPYDVERDIVSVTTAVVGPFAVLVSPELPVKSVAELIAYARAYPGRLNFGTPGSGSSVHLASEHFKASAGLDIVHVPYKGANPALLAAMAGEVQLVIDPLATAKRYAESGKLRALAVTTAQRTPLWPEMPTVSESGLPGYEAEVWYGIHVPARTPAATVAQLNAEFVAILKSPDMVQWLQTEGLRPVANTPEQARRFLLDDIQRWKTVTRAAGIKAE